MNNSFGSDISYTIYGDSHSEYIELLIKKLPEEFNIMPEDFIKDISRRKPGQTGTTSRIEDDIPELIWKENTFWCKKDLRIRFKNSNKDDSVYEEFKYHPRPSHADYVQYGRYPNRTFYGGGAASGRMTILLVAAGVVAKKLLDFYGFNIEYDSTIIQIGKFNYEDDAENYIKELSSYGDSCGAKINCTLKNVPKFLGEPFFNSTESIISQLVFSIPGIKGIEFGDGFDCVNKLGSFRNDKYIDENGKTSTNNEGGINGGYTNGNDLSFNVAVKPTASIYKSQETYNFKTKQIETLQIKGRHDACFAKRVPVILEAVAAIAIVELYNKYEDEKVWTSR